MKKLIGELKTFLKLREPISYLDYVNKFLNLTKSFAPRNVPTDVSLILSLRVMYFYENYKAIKIMSVLVVYGILAFQGNTPTYFKLSTIFIGLLLITYYFFFLEKLLPQWCHYYTLKTNLLRYQETINHCNYSEAILKDYLILSEFDKGTAYAKALYEETKESWINDVTIQDTNFERILILYYTLNKKLNIKKNHSELVYLVSTLICVGESNASKKKIGALRKLNEMYYEVTRKEDLCEVRQYLPKVKTILQDIIKLVELDMHKIDSLK